MVIEEKRNTKDQDGTTMTTSMTEDTEQVRKDSGAATNVIKVWRLTKFLKSQNNYETTKVVGILVVYENLEFTANRSDW